MESPAAAGFSYIRARARARADINMHVQYALTHKGNEDE